MEKLTKELAVKEFEKIQSMMGDNEMAHVGESELKDWFNSCLEKSMYDTIEEITEIAKIMCQVTKLDYNRWFA